MHDKVRILPMRVFKKNIGILLSLLKEEDDYVEVPSLLQKIAKFK